MVFVLLISDCVQKILVTTTPTAVFRRAVSLTVQANRSLGISPIVLDNVFDSNLMLPTVSKVVSVGDCIANPRSKPCQAIAIFAFSVLNLKLGIGIAVGSNGELMKMAIGPTDRSLNHFVKLCKRDAATD